MKASKRTKNGMQALVLCIVGGVPGPLEFLGPVHGVSAETALYGAILRLSVASRISGVMCLIKCNYSVDLPAYQRWLRAPDAPWGQLRRQVACLDHAWLRLEGGHTCLFAKERVLNW